MMEDSTIAKRIKEARLRAGMSQTALGVASGMDPSVASPRMNQYERGKHTPDPLTAGRIARALSVPAPYLYADDDLMAEIILLVGRLDDAGKIELVKDLKARATTPEPPKA